MTFMQFVTRVTARLRRDLESMDARSKMAFLRLFNLIARSSVLSATGPVVSTTSYGGRVKSAFYSIESVGRGTTKPSRYILWLDDPQALHSLPASLRRLEMRGLEIRLTNNYGPHTKYYPYVDATEEFALPLATADDDIMYPRWWLTRLVAAQNHFPNAVHCYRARRVLLHGDALTSYINWPVSTVQGPTAINFPTSVSGMFYPPAFLSVLKGRGQDFVAVTPKNDDIWVHETAVSHGYEIRQVHKRGRHFAPVQGTQGSALWRTNVEEGGNDVQIASTYSDRDVAVLALAARTA